jgi:hypothetical protein
MNIPRFLRFLHATYLTSSIHISPHHEPQLHILHSLIHHWSYIFHLFPRETVNSTTVDTPVLSSSMSSSWIRTFYI